MEDEAEKKKRDAEKKIAAEAEQKARAEEAEAAAKAAKKKAEEEAREKEFEKAKREAEEAAAKKAQDEAAKKQKQEEKAKEDAERKEEDVKNRPAPPEFVVHGRAGESAVAQQVHPLRVPLPRLKQCSARIQHIVHRVR